jgi:hypothetical protein
MSDFDELGSLGGGYDHDEGSTLTSRLLEDAGDAGLRTDFPGIEPAKTLPVNKATMECLRGPCKHYWVMTSRADMQSDRINLQRMRQCNCFVGEETNLTEQNVFDCGQWWPATLAFIPESLRPMLRPKLRAAWDAYLKHKGYDFSWKHWTDDIFEKSDRPEERSKIFNADMPFNFNPEPQAKKRNGA